MKRSPTPEEWQAIQGGPPIILQNPKGRVFELIHAYRRQEGDYTGPLAVVPTPRNQLLGTAMLHLVVPSTTDEVVAPAALLWERHGQPCEQRPGTSPYTRLKPHEVDGYVQKKLKEGWVQKVFNLEL